MEGQLEWHSASCRVLDISGLHLTAVQDTFIITPFKARKNWIKICSTLYPGPSLLSKWWGLTYKHLNNAAKMLQESGVFCHVSFLLVFWQPETVDQMKRRHFIMFSATKCCRIFGVSWLQPCQVVSLLAHYFGSREGPGDKVCLCFHSVMVTKRCESLEKWIKVRTKPKF